MNWIYYTQDWTWGQLCYTFIYEDERIVGSFCFEKQPGELAKLMGVYVDPNYRKLGYGRMLLNKAIGLERTFILEIIDKDLISFYTSFGIEWYAGSWYIKE